MAKNDANFHLKSTYQIRRLIQEDVLVFHYEGIHLKTKERLWIVQFKEDFQTPALVRVLIKRAEALYQLHHPNLFELMDYHYDGRHVYLVYTQQLGLTLLAERIGVGKRVSFQEVKGWASTLLDVYSLFESKGLPAGITLRQLYVTPEGELRVLCPSFHVEVLRDGIEVLSGLEEAVCYPPELLEQGYFTVESDVYMAGVLLYVLFSRRWPYENTIILEEMRKQFLHGPYPFRPVFSSIADQMSQVVAVAMANDPSKRFSSFEAMIEACEGETDILSYSTESSIEAPIMNEIRHNLNKRNIQRTLIWIKRVLMAVAILVAALTIHQFYTNFMMAIPDIAVPNVVGLSQEEATKVLSKDLTPEIGGDRYHHNIPKGHVVETKPTFGIKVKQKRPVKIYLSKGPIQLETPYLIGRSVGQAKSMLQSNMDRLEVVEEVFSPTEEAGVILSQEPSANSALEDGKTIQVTVSKGFPITCQIEPMTQRLTKKAKPSSRVAISFVTMSEWPAMEIKVVLQSGVQTDVLHQQVYEPGSQKNLSFELDAGSVIEVFANETSVLKETIPN